VSVKIDIDASEIYKLAKDLDQAAPKQIRRAARKVVVSEIGKVLTHAKSDAPKDRPWLATQGLRRRTSSYPDAVLGTVYSVPDKKGRPVGFFVLFGTASTAPQDFFAPALAAAERTFPAAALAAPEPLSGDGGGGGGGEDGGDD